MKMRSRVGAGRLSILFGFGGRFAFPPHPPFGHPLPDAAKVGVRAPRSPGNRAAMSE